MSRRPVLQFAPDLSALALAQLEPAGRAQAWLIDVGRGSVLAATTAGAALLGHSDEATPPLLDAAMPALGRLRSLAADAGEELDRAHPLAFWTRTGTVRCLCSVRLLRAQGAVLAMVTALEPGKADPAAHGFPLPPGDDAAKLKEIARRIRDGQTSAGRAARWRGRAGPLQGAAPAPEAERNGDARTDLVAVPAASHRTSEAASRLLRANLAHELRTPLGAIAAAAEAMKEQRFGPIGSTRYLGYARDIHGTAEHALAVIERMLADARDAAAHEDRGLAFAEVDAAALLRSSISQIGPLAERAGIALVLDVAPRLPHLVADATSLKQIVLNLLTNALKFTQRGGEIKVSVRYAGDGPLEIAVSDTGVGMNARDVRHALGGERPAAGRGADGRAAASGLGIGLPLVRDLAAANGAELVIESAPGRGTSASVIFRKDRVVPV